VQELSRQEGRAGRNLIGSTLATAGKIDNWGNLTCEVEGVHRGITLPTWSWEEKTFCRGLLWADENKRRSKIQVSEPRKTQIS